MDDVALVHLADAGAAVERAGDGGVGQVGARGVDLRLVLPHQRLVLRHRRLLGVGGLGGGVGGGGELLVAHQVHPRIGQVRLVLRLLGRRLVQRRLVGPRVDAGQHVPGAHVLALLEGDLQQRAVDHRLDADGVERLHGAERVQEHRHVAQLRRGRQHGDRIALGAARPRPAVLVLRGRVTPELVPAARAGGGEREQQQNRAELHVVPVARGSVHPPPSAL